jgi:CRISPR-associated protein Cmr4
MANLKRKKITAMATDPIYIGTGGFTIGRVDNTIVRDPITKIPKIPGSSIAGTWRYYVALELQSAFKDTYKKELSKREEKKDKIAELFKSPKEWMKNFNGNRFARIKCAGQDDKSQMTLEDSQNSDTGHCGHCIVCKSFGFSKSNLSNQGMLFFSDLNILFFPVYTRVGVRWITSPKLLDKEIAVQEQTILTKKGNENYLNLGWLNLKVKGRHNLTNNDLKDTKLKLYDIVIVPDGLISQIINSNLEVRTSVSIDPITGASKDGALFTSEAIPRGTVFCGEVRGFKREGDNSLPSLECVFEALEESKQYFKTLGVGGMTTRGFGRVDILSKLNVGECKDENTNS